MQRDIVINDIVVNEQIQIATRIGVDGVTFTPHIGGIFIRNYTILY